MMIMQHPNTHILVILRNKITQIQLKQLAFNKLITEITSVLNQYKLFNYRNHGNINE